MSKVLDLRPLLSIVFLVLSIAGWSQTKDPAIKAKERTDQITKDLGLDADRAAQVDAINLLHYRKMAEIKASTADEDSKKASTEKAKETHRAALKRVLTAEQFKKLEALQAERKAVKKAEKKKESGTPGKKVPTKTR